MFSAEIARKKIETNKKSTWANHMAEGIYTFIERQICKCEIHFAVRRAESGVVLKYPMIPKNEEYFTNPKRGYKVSNLGTNISW